MATKSGGYDFKFIETPDDLICVICQFVARDPQQVGCCGKIFCKSCIKAAKGKFSDCPNCRGSAKTFSDQRSARQIKSLKISCKNEERGCTWVGKLEDYDSHDSGCEFAQVDCPNICSEQVLKCGLQNHLESTCPLRKVECEACRELVAQVDLQSHLALCPDVTVLCPNKCDGDKLLRHQIPAHHIMCPKEVVTCSYSEAGCNVRLFRQDLQKHVSESTELHLKLAMEKISTLKQNLRYTEERNRTPPVTFKMPSFAEKKENDVNWISPKFYSHTGGYKMCLIVHPNGFGAGKGTHLSVYIHLVYGENDDNISWPFRGEVTVELLNQQQDASHHSYTCHFNDQTPSDCVDRVTTYGMNTGWGAPSFMSYKLLTPGTSYCKDECLYFRITKVTLSPPLQSWLICSPTW